MSSSTETAPVSLAVLLPGYTSNARVQVVKVDPISAIIDTLDVNEGLVINHLSVQILSA